jgi:hypothetical protein
MSHGDFGEKHASFTVVGNRQSGHLLLSHVDGDDAKGIKDKILIMMSTNSGDYLSNIQNRTSILIDKRYAMILAHWFTRASEVVEKWYEKERANGPLLYRGEGNERFTDEQIASVCLSMRHDFGLMSREEREKMMFEARAWEHAIRKEREGRWKEDKVGT